MKPSDSTQHFKDILLGKEWERLSRKSRFALFLRHKLLVALYADRGYLPERGPEVNGEGIREQVEGEGRPEPGAGLCTVPTQKAAWQR